jgi:hypothetical protein
MHKSDRRAIVTRVAGILVLIVGLLLAALLNMGKSEITCDAVSKSARTVL